MVLSYLKLEEFKIIYGPKKYTCILLIETILVCMKGSTEWNKNLE